MKVIKKVLAILLIACLILPTTILANTPSDAKPNWLLVKLAKFNDESKYQLSQFYMEHKQYKKAKTPLLELYKSNFQKKVILNNLGLVYFHTQQYQKSLYYFNQGIKEYNDPNNKFIVAGIYLEGKGVKANPKLTIELLKQALSQKGLNKKTIPFAYLFIGLSYLRLDNLPQAKIYLAKSASLGDKTSKYIFNKLNKKNK